MNPLRTITYLEDTQIKIKELVNSRLGSNYAEFIPQLEEMYAFLLLEYRENALVMEELKYQPRLVKPSIFNQDHNELLSLGFLGVMTPYLLILLFSLSLPLTIIFLVIRWQNKNKAIERLRMLESHLNRIIYNIKLSA